MSSSTDLPSFITSRADEICNSYAREVVKKNRFVVINQNPQEKTTQTYTTRYRFVADIVSFFTGGFVIGKTQMQQLGKYALNGIDQEAGRIKIKVNGPTPQLKELNKKVSTIVDNMTSLQKPKSLQNKQEIMNKLSLLRRFNTRKLSYSEDVDGALDYAKKLSEDDIDNVEDLKNLIEQVKNKIKLIKILDTAEAVQIKGSAVPSSKRQEKSQNIEQLIQHIKEANSLAEYQQLKRSLETLRKEEGLNREIVLAEAEVVKLEKRIDNQLDQQKEAISSKLAENQQRIRTIEDDLTKVDNFIITAQEHLGRAAQEGVPKQSAELVRWAINFTEKFKDALSRNLNNEEMRKEILTRGDPKVASIYKLTGDKEGVDLSSASVRQILTEIFQTEGAKVTKQLYDMETTKSRVSSPGREAMDASAITAAIEKELPEVFQKHTAQSLEILRNALKIVSTSTDQKAVLRALMMLEQRSIERRSPKLSPREVQNQVVKKFRRAKGYLAELDSRSFPHLQKAISSGLEAVSQLEPSQRLQEERTRLRATIAELEAKEQSIGRFKGEYSLPSFEELEQQDLKQEVAVDTRQADVEKLRERDRILSKGKQAKKASLEKELQKLTKLATDNLSQEEQQKLEGLIKGMQQSVTTLTQEIASLEKGLPPSPPNLDEGPSS